MGLWYSFDLCWVLFHNIFRTTFHKPGGNQVFLGFFRLDFSISLEFFWIFIDKNWIFIDWNTLLTLISKSSVIKSKVTVLVLGKKHAFFCTLFFIWIVYGELEHKFIDFIYTDNQLITVRLIKHLNCHISAKVLG